jgi:hypothetical protein
MNPGESGTGERIISAEVYDPIDRQTLAVYAACPELL